MNSIKGERAVLGYLPIRTVATTISPNLILCIRSTKFFN